MKTSKECRQITPILEMVANGTATEQEIHIVELHTETCSTCHAEYERWKQTTNLVANWRTADVPESCRNWSDLHARLTAPQPQKLRPAFPLRLGWGGVVGAMAVGTLCFIAMRPAQIPTNEPTVAINESVSTKTNLTEEPPHAERSMITPAAAKTAPVQKENLDIPTLIMAKSEEPSLPPSRKERTKRINGAWKRVNHPFVAQTRPKPQEETPRRVILGVDGESATPERDSRYTLGAVPNGHVSGEAPRYVIGGIDTSANQLTPASYSSSEKTAW